MKEKYSPSEVNLTIGRGIRFIRDKEGFTLNDFSRKLKKSTGLILSPNLLGKIERGESSIQINQFILVCKTFEVNIDFFFKDLKIEKGIQLKMEKLLDNKTIQNILKLFIENSEDEILIHHCNSYIQLVSILIQKIKEKNLNPNEGLLLAASKNKTKKYSF